MDEYSHTIFRIACVRKADIPAYGPEICAPSVIVAGEFLSSFLVGKGSIHLLAHLFRLNLTS